MSRLSRRPSRSMEVPSPSTQLPSLRFPSATERAPAPKNMEPAVEGMEAPQRASFPEPVLYSHAVRPGPSTLEDYTDATDFHGLRSPAMEVDPSDKWDAESLPSMVDSENFQPPIEAASSPESDEIRNDVSRTSRDDRIRRLQDRLSAINVRMSSQPPPAVDVPRAHESVPDFDVDEHELLTKAFAQATPQAGEVVKMRRQESNANAISAAVQELADGDEALERSLSEISSKFEHVLHRARYYVPSTSFANDSDISLNAEVDENKDTLQSRYLHGDLESLRTDISSLKSQIAPSESAGRSQSHRDSSDNREVEIRNTDESRRLEKEIELLLYETERLREEEKRILQSSTSVQSTENARQAIEGLRSEMQRLLLDAEMSVQHQNDDASPGPSLVRDVGELHIDTDFSGTTLDQRREHLNTQRPSIRPPKSPKEIGADLERLMDHVRANVTSMRAARAPNHATPSPHQRHVHFDGTADDAASSCSLDEEFNRDLDAMAKAALMYAQLEDGTGSPSFSTDNSPH